MPLQNSATDLDLLLRLNSDYIASVNDFLCLHALTAGHEEHDDTMTTKRVC